MQHVLRFPSNIIPCLDFTFSEGDNILIESKVSTYIYESFLEEGRLRTCTLYVYIIYIECYSVVDYSGSTLKELNDGLNAFSADEISA